MRYVKRLLIGPVLSAAIVIVSIMALIALGGQLASTESASGVQTIKRSQLGQQSSEVESGVRTTKRGCRVAWARKGVTWYGQEVGWSKLEVGWCYNGSKVTDKNVNFYNAVTGIGNAAQWDLASAEKRCGFTSDAHRAFECKSQTRFKQTVGGQNTGQKYIELWVYVDRFGYSNVGAASGGGGGGSW